MTEQPRGSFHTHSLSLIDPHSLFLTHPHTNTNTISQVLIPSFAQEYHRTATELKLIPSTAKHADGVSYEIPVASRGNGVEQVR